MFDSNYADFEYVENGKRDLSRVGFLGEASTEENCDGEEEKHDCCVATGTNLEIHGNRKRKDTEYMELQEEIQEKNHDCSIATFKKTKVDLAKKGPVVQMFTQYS